MDFLDFTVWMIYIIEFVGALLIVGYVVAASWVLLREKNIPKARLVVAEGAIMGLSFKLAGTLLKTIELHTWGQILVFIVIFALRTLLKRLFIWEKGQLQRSGAVQTSR